MKSLLLSVLVGCLLMFNGCNTTDPKTNDFIEGALPYIESGSTLAATMVLDYGVSDSDRVVKAKCLYGIAKGLRTLTGGQLPTVEELQETLESSAINDGLVWVRLSQSLSKIYANELAKIDGDPKLALEIIEALASGVEKAAEPYAHQM